MPKIKLQAHILDHIKKFPDKIQDKKMLQRFLGILTYAEMYVNKLSELRKPLQKKLKDKVRWTWEEADTNYVKKLKNKFNHLPALYHPLPEDYMIIETDASDLYWGGILKARKIDKEENL